MEQALIDHLQHFLLELGRGFSFVARQKKFTLDGQNFFIDLVFYNYILPEDKRQIFASKYLTYLPTEEELKKELRLDDFQKLDD